MTVKVWGFMLGIFLDCSFTLIFEVGPLHQTSSSAISSLASQPALRMDLHLLGTTSWQPNPQGIHMGSGLQSLAPSLTCAVSTQSPNHLPNLRSCFKCSFYFCRQCFILHITMPHRLVLSFQWPSRLRPPIAGLQVCATTPAWKILHIKVSIW